MRLAFVVADPRAQEPTFATVYLAQAALRRGHDVAFAGVDELTLSASDEVTARMVRAPAFATHTAFCAALAAAEPREENLHGFDAVFVRFHPLAEGGAVHNPTDDFGWRLKLAGVLVVNDPEGTRNAGGRTYLSSLPAAIRPRTLITRSASRAKKFLAALDAPAVLKPLEERPGDQTFYVEKGQSKNLNQMITVVKKRGYMVAEEYLPEAVHGEKRLLLLGGEPIRAGGRAAIYRRLLDQPALDGTLARSARPGARERCELGPAEQRIVDVLRPRLVAEGLYFVGVDIVGDKILEVNVFTPGGIHANRELYGIDIGDVVVRDLERRVAAKPSSPRRQRA